MPLLVFNTPDRSQEIAINMYMYSGGAVPAEGCSSRPHNRLSPVQSRRDLH